MVVHSGPMQGNNNTSVKAVDDLILKTYSLAKLQRALKNRMNVKTSSNHKEFSPECMNSTSNNY